MNIKRLQEAGRRIAAEHWLSVCMTAYKGYVKDGRGACRMFVPRNRPKSFEPTITYYSADALRERQLLDEYVSGKVSSYDPDNEFLLFFGFGPAMNGRMVLLHLKGELTPAEVYNGSSVSKLRLVWDASTQDIDEGGGE